LPELIGPGLSIVPGRFFYGKIPSLAKAAQGSGKVKAKIPLFKIAKS